jgi:hypothetical protein
LRFSFNGLPPSADPAEGVDPGRPIRQPGRWASAILAALAGMIILSFPLTASIVYSFRFPDVNQDPSFQNRIIPWAGMAIVFGLCISAHELLHALLHPDGGRSVLILNWRKLQFGVYFEGRIPRDR